MSKRKLIVLRFFISCNAMLMLIACTSNSGENILIEAERFEEKGGWLVDPQFVEQMRSPYLLAHGMGRPVKDARYNRRFPDSVVMEKRVLSSNRYIHEPRQ